MQELPGPSPLIPGPYHGVCGVAVAAWLAVNQRPCYARCPEFDSPQTP
jgi:hypothetical protein